MPPGQRLMNHIEKVIDPTIIKKLFNIYWITWNISPIFVSYINGRNGSRLRKEVDKMQNRNRQHNESGYLMLNGPDDGRPRN